MSDEVVKNHRRPHLQGFEVYQWPEFIALARRLGVDYDQKTKSITITLTEDHVIIIQRYKAVDTLPTPDHIIDTTVLHNKEFRTYTPAKKESE